MWLPCTAFSHPSLPHLALRGGAQHLRTRVRKALTSVGCSKRASLWLIPFGCSALASRTSPRRCPGALCAIPSLALSENVLMKCRAPWHEEFWACSPGGSCAATLVLTSLFGAGGEGCSLLPTSCVGFFFCVSLACW